MYRTIARVKSGRLYQSQTESNPIVVGSSAWLDWLEHHRAFLFLDRKGRFTACKIDTEPDGVIWEAVRTRNGQRCRVYLGRSHELTLERLHAAVQAFAILELTGADQAASGAFKHRKHTSATPVGSPRSLLQTKLYRPRVGSEVIPRARLIKRLDAALEGKATLVCAPAGFGKTTLVGEWVRQSGAQPPGCPSMNVTTSLRSSSLRSWLPCTPSFPLLSELPAACSLLPTSPHHIALLPSSSMT